MLLTSRQKAIVRRREIQAFNLTCAQFGVKPAERIAFILRQWIAQREAVIEALGRDHPTSQLLLEELASLRAPQDFWEIARGRNDARKRHHAETILEHRAALPIDSDYIASLSSELGADPNDADHLACVLRAVPITIRMDHDFNAFVTRDAVIGNVPLICVYAGLLAAVEAASDVLLPVVLERNDRGQFDDRDALEVRATAMNLEYVASMQGVLGVLFGTSMDAYGFKSAMFSKMYPDAYVSLQEVALAAERFVWFHELGHLLRGHLRSAPAREMEFEADEFAMRAVVLSSDRRTLGWTLSGVVLLFALIEVIEREYVVASMTHPKTSDRLSAVLSLLTEPLRSAAARKVGATRAALLVPLAMRRKRTEMKH